MKLPEELIEMIEDAGFAVEYDGERCGLDGINDYYNFQRCSPYGHDFSFELKTGKNLDSFADRIKDYYDDFDVSYEAFLWLDNTGHGKNGAPYEMIDVYEDMESCQEYVLDLLQIVCEYQDESEED